MRRKKQQKARYYWDQEAVKEGCSENTHSKGPEYHPMNKTAEAGNGIKQNTSFEAAIWGKVTSRNLRTVWNIATHPYSGAHFATFPPALVEPMVKASTSERGCCPKCGKAWERVVERSNPSKQANTGPDERYGSLDNMGSNHQTVAGLHRNGGGVYSSAKTTGFRPGCACYPRTDEWREYITAKPGKELTVEQEAENERIRAIRAELLVCWQPLEAQPCTVLDPFGGAGTTGLVASRLGRHAVLIELNPEYAEMARRRIYEDAPLLNRGAKCPPPAPSTAFAPAR